MSTPTLTKPGLPSRARTRALRRSARIEAELTRARRANAQVILTGVPVHDLFVDPDHRALWLPDLVRSYCERNQLGLVVYRLSDGATSLPTLPCGVAVPIRDLDPQQHPADAIAQLLADLREFTAPAIFLFDYADSLLPAGDLAPTLEIALLCERLQVLTADVAQWQRPGLQLVLVDRGAGLMPRIAHQPGFHTIQTSAPDVDETTVFIERATVATATARLHLDSTLGILEASRLSGGLLLRDVNEMRAASALAPVSAEQLADLKGRAIDVQSRRTLELLGGTVDFRTDVAGMPGFRLHLQNLQLIGKSTARVVLTGPPGTGKTYSALAAARSRGVALVSFGQILGELLGQAENNMTHALLLLLAMAPIAVFVDEAENGSLGGAPAGGRTANEAYGALRAMLFKFFGDTGDENGVSLIATTNDPDRLDPRTRSRFTFLPILFASPAELVDILTIQARRSGVELVSDISPVVHAYTESGRVLSGRTAQRVLDGARIRAARSGLDHVRPEHLEAALRGQIKDDWDAFAEYSTLSSVLSVDDEEALPWVAAQVLGENYPVPVQLRQYWRDGALDVDAVQRRIDTLSRDRLFA